VRVSARGESGGPARLLRTMTAPSYFGEIGVLERIPRTATVTALIDCRCERIEGEALLEALTFRSAVHVADGERAQSPGAHAPVAETRLRGSPHRVAPARAKGDVTGVRRARDPLAAIMSA